MMIPILLGVLLIMMLLTDIKPGGHTKTPAPAADETGEAGASIMMPVEDPLITRYARYVVNLLHGDLGRSSATKRPVWKELMQRFPYTLLLTVVSLFLAVGIGIPLGIFAATHQYTWRDNLSIFVTLICIATPNFLFALLIVRLFAVRWRILPLAGIETWQSWVLPVVSLALGNVATIARQMRSNILEVIKRDYIATARAKGQSEVKVLYRHALKNALTPVIMTIGSIFGASLGGALIIEVIFSVPGLGIYTLTGLNNRDYPVIIGSVLFLSFLFCVVMLAVDVLFAAIDPRVRLQYVAGGRRFGRRKAKDT
jgi:peptide/nickel transport system permease protein